MSLGGFITSIENHIKGAASAVLHFFTSTTAGQTIEHVVVSVVSVPGLKDFIAHFEQTVKDDLHAALSALESPTSDGVKAVIEAAIAKLEADAKAAVSGGILQVTHGSWANFLVNLAYMGIKAAIPLLANL